MNKSRLVRLGYEVGTGRPVDIPIGHLCVTGQSQRAGKTTALEGLLRRADRTAIAFVTKRGEGSFRGFSGRHGLIPPYFRERADWQFVASLIDATMGEKNRILRSFLMKACRTTKTLHQVLISVRALKENARGFPESIYTEIEGYLELVVPQVASLPPAGKLVLAKRCVNIMDLSPYRPELQGLIIRSVLEHIYQHEDETIVVIPEAWEFLPEQRGSPVRLSFETLVRKGGALQNFAWIDSQDLAGVWKLAVRACPVILVGVQREANEIKRTLANIPSGVAKPSAADIATLEVGQFYACWGSHAVKVYAQPAWLLDERAISHATGKDPLPMPDVETTPKEKTVTEKEARELRQEIQELKDKLDAALAENQRFRLERRAHPLPIREQTAAEKFVAAGRAAQVAVDSLTIPVHPNGGLQPTDLEVQVNRPELTVVMQRPKLTVDGESLKGRILILMSEQFFIEPKSCGQIRTGVKRIGPDTNTANISRVMDELVKFGFVTEESSGYRATEGAVARVVTNEVQ